MTSALDTAWEISNGIVRGEIQDNRPERLKTIGQIDWSTRSCELYHRFLFAWAEQIQPSLVVETGTDRGYSGINLALGCASAKVISIDNRSLCSDQLNALDIPNVETITSDSLQVSDRFEDHSVDLLFLDSHHTYEHLSKEIELYVPKVRRGGVVLVDDITMDAGMVKAWDSIVYPKRTFDGMHDIWGFGAFQV